MSKRLINFWPRAAGDFPDFRRMGGAKRYPSSPPEIACLSCRIPRPILGVHTRQNHSVKRRIGPILHSRYMAVLHRIEVNVVGVALKIALVPYRVLPVSPLPNAPLILAVPAARNLLTLGQGSRELGLDQSPAQGEIGVSVGQCPDHMQMLR